MYKTVKMYKTLVHGVLAIIGLSAAFAPAQSQACWLTRCFSCCKPKPATFCPPPAPACEVCPQQVSYVPQTCYRAVETCVPVTACRPETVCDPCTGCPQTVMRPVTTYVRRQVMVPYTTLRPVVTPVAAVTTGAAYNSPYYTGAAMTTGAPMMTGAPGGCSNCAPGYTTPTVAAPAATYGTPAYGTPPYSAPMTTPQPSLPMGTPTPAPTPGTAPNGSPPTTFENNGQPPAGGSTGNTPPAAYRAIPDAQNLQSAPPYNGGPTTGAPQLLNPDPQNRTTARPMYRSASILPAIFGLQPGKNIAKTASNIVKTASATSTVEPTAPPVDDGWRPLGGR